MDILPTFLTALVTSGVVTATINWFITSKERTEQRRWEIKREACLDALRIIDSRFADYQWTDSNRDPLRIDFQEEISTAEIRSCFNRLILACTNKDVPVNFEKCLHLNLGEQEASSLSMTAVVDLRNAIRRELGFGNELITKVSWITYIDWKNRNSA